MRVALTARHFPLPQDLGRLAERRAGFALGRFAGRVGDVRLRVARGKGAVACVATAQLLPGHLLSVHAAAATVESAIADACERLRLRIVRVLGRRRDRARS